MNQKIGTWLGTIIIVIIAFTAGMFVWQAEKNYLDIDQAPYQNNIKAQVKKVEKPDEAANWKTFADSRLGFQVKHPDDWKEEKPAMDMAGIALASSDGSGVTITFWEDIPSFPKGGTTDPKTFNDLMKDVQFKNPKAIIFEGSPAFTATVENSVVGLSQTNIVISHNNHIYSILYNNADKSIELDKKIISTFSFNLKETSEQSKVYTNSKYGFSFEYPSNLSIEENENEGPGGSVFLVNIGENLSIDVAKIEKDLRNGIDPLSEPNGMDPASKKDIAIAGLKGRVYNTDEVYVVAKNGYQYFIARDSEANDQKTKDLLKNIVTSFKITK